MQNYSIVPTPCQALAEKFLCTGAGVRFHALRAGTMKK